MWTYLSWFNQLSRNSRHSALGFHIEKGSYFSVCRALLMRRKRMVMILPGFRKGMLFLRCGSGYEITLKRLRTTEWLHSRGRLGSFPFLSSWLRKNVCIIGYPAGYIFLLSTHSCSVPVGCVLCTATGTAAERFSWSSPLNFSQFPKGSGGVTDEGTSWKKGCQKGNRFSTLLLSLYKNIKFWTLLYRNCLVKFCGKFC